MVNKEDDESAMKRRLEKLEELKRRQRMTIPPDGWFSNIWDALMLIALLYTAVVMPLEIGFIHNEPVALVGANMVFDFFFFVDMGVSMHLAVFDESRGRNIRDTCEIRKRYIKSWFAIDFISFVPFEQFSSNKLFKVIKVLKLLRLFRIGRLFTRWQPDIGFRYTILTLSGCLLSAITLSHWGACLWGVVAYQIGDPQDSWISDNGILDYHWAHQYLCALYWSTMTLTTIGYGDYGPINAIERFAASFFCMLGGLVYAYLVGIITGTILELKHAQAEYIRMRDMLNGYMEDLDLPGNVRKEARLYFRENRGRYRRDDQTEALHQLSPGLELKLREYWHGQWLSKMKILHIEEYKDEATKFRKCLLHRLNVESFPRKEALIKSGALASKMYVVKRGILAKSGKLIGRYDVIGEDVILFLIQPEARRPYRVMTLTFVDLYTLHKNDIKDALDNGEFPNVRHCMRKSAIKLALKLAFIKHGRELRLKKIALQNKQERIKKRKEKREKKKEEEDEGRISFDGRFSTDDRASSDYGRISVCSPELRGFPAYRNKDLEESSAHGIHWSDGASYAVIGKQLDRLLNILGRIEVACDKMS